MDELDPAQQPYEPWLFLAMVEQLSSSEVSLGFIYSVLDLLARRYLLSDAVIILKDQALGTQAFRLGQRSVNGDAPSGMGTAPGVFTEPDVVPEIIRDAVQSVCQLALTLHLARYGASHDQQSSIGNRRQFDDSLRIASEQSSRYGWPFTLVLFGLKGFATLPARVGRAVVDDLLRAFGSSLRHSVRSGDTVAQIGDGEFAVILWNSLDTEFLAFTERLRSLLTSSPDLAIAIGAAQSPGDTTDPTELFRIATTGLHEEGGMSLP
jgi:diguanylate cyclase (GGDEF)-like protein